MEDFGFGLGVLLAILGPLLLIPVTWVAYLLLRPVVLHRLIPRVSKGAASWIALAVSCFIVAGALVLSYVPGRIEFDRLCSEHAIPTVSERVRTDGFYRTRLYPYEARPFLEGDSFVFVEAPHMYKEGVYVRYTKTEDETIHEQEVSTLNSLYGVRETLSELAYRIMMTEKVAYEMETNRELARAANIVYEGGPLSLLLGVYGMSSCPDIRSPEGSQHFKTFYELETITLRAPAAAEVEEGP